MLPEWANDSLIARQICSADFPYLQPWFYDHPYALRCELAVGERKRERSSSAKERAWAIFCILFENGVDAVFFNQWLEDLSGGDQLHGLFAALRKTLQQYFLLRRWMKYPFYIVRHLDNDEQDTAYIEHRNRIVCYTRGERVDFQKLIEQQADAAPGHFEPISFVSFENECIMSIYSHLGCDIVFSSREKMQQFFEPLKPYLYDYDMEEMLERIGCIENVDNSSNDFDETLPF